MKKLLTFIENQILKLTTYSEDRYLFLSYSTNSTWVHIIPTIIIETNLINADRPLLRSRLLITAAFYKWSFFIQIYFNK